MAELGGWSDPGIPFVQRPGSDKRELLMLRASLTNACMFRFACIVRLTARLTITQNATGWFCLRSELPQLLDPFSDLYCLRSERRLSYEYEHRPEMISIFRFVKEAGQPESKVRPPPNHGTKSVLTNVHNICTLASLPYSMLAQPFNMLGFGI